MRRPAAVLVLALLAALPPGAAPPPAAAQEREVTIQVKELRGSVRMLVGQDGNLGVRGGEDDEFLIDDQFAPLTEKILAAIRTFTDEPVRFVVNTHWHGDHTGGNENLGERGAVIVAHDNVRERMSTEQFMKAFDRRVEPAPRAALPIVTFTESVTFHLNGDTIRVIHVDPAHTDGDSIVHFEKANVLHTGDLFFKGRYPFIDLSSGGSIDGVIAAADRALGLCDDETQIIPGHGDLATRADYAAYRDVLRTVRDGVAAQIAAGRTREEVMASDVTAAYDAEWGQGFIRGPAFLATVYDSLRAAADQAAGDEAVETDKSDD